MKRVTGTIAMAGAILLLAACGSREQLQLASNQSAPPVAANATKKPTTEELLTAPAAVRPQRLDDSLKRSEEREDDRFDLPPTH